MFLFITFFLYINTASQTIERIDESISVNGKVITKLIDKNNHLWCLIMNDSTKSWLLDPVFYYLITKYDGNNWEIIDTDEMSGDKVLFLDKNKDIWCIAGNYLFKYDLGKWKQMLTEKVQGVCSESKEYVFIGNKYKDGELILETIENLPFIDSKNNFWLISNENEKKGMLLKYDGKNLFEYPSTLPADKKETIWTSGKEDLKSNIWLFNKTYLKKINYNNYGVVHFYDNCGYKLSDNSIIKFKDLTQDFIENGDEIVVMRTEHDDKLILSFKTIFSFYSQSDGSRKNFEKINEIPIDRFDKYLTNGINHDYSFLVGKKDVARYDGERFYNINIDSIFNCKKIEIDHAVYSGEGLWLATKEGILRYYNKRWSVFNKSGLNSDILQKKAFKVYGIEALDDNIILFGTNTGIYQWQSGKLIQLINNLQQALVIFKADVMENNIVLYSTNTGIFQWKSGILTQLLAQPLTVWGTEVTDNNTVYFRTNQGIFKWDKEEWSQLITKFGLNRDLSYKSFPFDNGLILEYADGSCTVMKNNKVGHFAPLSSFKGFGEKEFQGFGNGILGSYVNIPLLVYENSWNGEEMFGFYNHINDEWSYEKIPKGDYGDMTVLSEEGESNKFICVIPVSKHGVYKYDGISIEPFDKETSVFFQLSVVHDQNIWLFASDGLWKISLDNMEIGTEED